MKVKTAKIALNGYGSFLGREKGCLVIRDRDGNEKKYPLFENEIGEIQIRSGNMVSSGVLATCGFWGIDVLILTRRGNPVAILKSLDDDSHVLTRVCQYEALKNDKALEIAKRFVIGKVEGQNQVLKKYGLKRIDYSVMETVENIEAESLELLRKRLLQMEGQCSRKYFPQIFGMVPEFLRPKRRKTFKAYDSLNNVFNLAYKVLAWKVHIALINVKLEPYLGFLHIIQWGMPSLICDFQELYRYLVDDFVIKYCMKLSPKDFILKDEYYAINKKGKRQYLNDAKNKDFLKGLNKYFLTKVNIPRIKRGQKQEIETLISEEALLFAKYLRNERQTWKPRIVVLE